MLNLGRSLFHNVVLRRPTPYVLLFEPSQRCNCRCPFCYHWREHAQGEMGLADIRRVLQQGRELGCGYLFLGGGEPLAAPHFDDTLLMASALGYRVNLTTNGSLLEGAAARIAPFVDRLSVSLDFPDERHDELRGRPGLFREVVDGAMAALRHGIGTRLTANVFRDNVNDLEALARLAAEMGCPLHARLMTRESAVLDETPVLESREARRAAALELLRLKKAGYAIATADSYLRTVAEERVFPCRLASFLVNVDAQGRVYLPCPRHEGTKDRVLGRIDDDHSLRDVWFGTEARRVREASLRCRPGPDCYSACVHDVSRLIEPDPGFWRETLCDRRSLGGFYATSALGRDGGVAP